MTTDEPYEPRELRYVYAVCHPLDAPLQAELTGVAGSPPRQLEHQGLVAVVGSVPERDFAEAPLHAHLEDLDWLTETARAHQNVIAALTTVTSPLPLRLATVFRDDAGVRLMMEQEERRFRAGLDRLAGRVEWGVKVYVEEPEAPAPAAGPATSGRDYLRRRRAERTARDDTWRRAEGFAQELHDELSLHAAHTRVHPPQNPELSRVSGLNVLNAAYLVERSDAEEFVERVDATKDREPDLRVELTGPWAGYSFTADDDEEGQT
ncbi:GvpL/GvpF family gas vesicle protein [Streptomyces sp. NBC_01016]|uniref:GvpL/GvpF family gas vesicle protein n=1 Tax=Streptomyces sp. NBC_01016 TaxID=2903720 RepID=UPI00224E6896|nr:GvpL/GvpF family gas vesicle protein [Streptomyces sp. NBC_01016]MCX4830423.1 GvpL/GvpF family gas vesicle protein [Streptomyces sp. NBC_01016]